MISQPLSQVSTRSRTRAQAAAKPIEKPVIAVEPSPSPAVAVKKSAIKKKPLQPDAPSSSAISLLSTSSKGISKKRKMHLCDHCGKMWRSDHLQRHLEAVKRNTATTPELSFSSAIMKARPSLSQYEVSCYLESLTLNAFRSPPPASATPATPSMR